MTAPLLHTASWLAANGSHEAAAKLLDQIEKEPGASTIEVRSLRALIHAQQGRYPDACREWDAVLAADPHNPGAQAGLRLARKLEARGVADPRQHRLRGLMIGAGAVGVLLVAAAFLIYRSMPERLTRDDLRSAFAELQKAQSAESLQFAALKDDAARRDGEALKASGEEARRWAGLEKSFAALDKNFAKLDSQTAELGDKLGALAARLASLENRTLELRGKVLDLSARPEAPMPDVNALIAADGSKTRDRVAALEQRLDASGGKTAERLTAVERALGEVAVQSAKLDRLSTQTLEQSASLVQVREKLGVLNQAEYFTLSGLSIMLNLPSNNARDIPAETASARHRLGVLLEKQLESLSDEKAPRSK